MAKRERKVERVDPATIDEKYILSMSFSTFQKEAIKLVYEMRILSLTQISKILNVTSKYASMQLAQLYKAGFLYKAMKEDLEFGKGTKEYYWMLDRGGAMFIAGAYDVPMKQINWDLRDNLIAFDKLKHSMKITEVRVQITEFARSRGHKIESAICDRHLYYEFKKDDKDITVRPDLLISYNDGTNIYQFFFEIDMGTMAVNGPAYRTSNVTSKIPKYEGFKSSGAWKEYFDVFPRVIFLTTTKNRALFMAESIKKAQETNQEFLISTFEFFEKNAEGPYKKSDSEETTLFQ